MDFLPEFCFRTISSLKATSKLKTMKCTLMSVCDHKSLFKCRSDYRFFPFVLINAMNTLPSNDKLHQPSLQFSFIAINYDVYDSDVKPLDKLKKGGIALINPTHGLCLIHI